MVLAASAAESEFAHGMDVSDVDVVCDAVRRLNRRSLNWVGADPSSEDRRSLSHFGRICAMRSSSGASSKVKVSSGIFRS